MCNHVNYEIVGSGFFFPKQRRDIEMACKDCGAEWTIFLFPNPKDAEIVCIKESN